MKIAIVDTYYPEALKTFQRSGSYAERLAQTLAHLFGTFDAYSRHLTALGWETLDIIANDEGLQRTWATENHFRGASLEAIALAQIEAFRPDVVFMQDLSFFGPATLTYLRNRTILAGQCSCPMPRVENISKFHVLFTSFRHYLAPFELRAVRAEFLPLAFDPIVLERTPIPEARSIAVSFVGGYGRHWATDDLFTRLAAEVPIEFYGYGFDAAPDVVRSCYRGEAWGVEMYRIYLRSQIVLNRHGTVAQGQSNNLRMFEATGCGALLLTEYTPDLSEYFTDLECVSYLNAEDALARIWHLLKHLDEVASIAARGRERTLATHTYADRMIRVSEVLKECLSLRMA